MSGTGEEGQVPELLRLLAEWIDFKYPNDRDPRVQLDLRKWADAWTTRDDELTRLRAEVERLVTMVQRAMDAEDPDEWVSDGQRLLADLKARMA